MEPATKRCARCEEEKPRTEFRVKKGKVLQPYCTPCQSAYHREHYEKNKAAYIASAKQQRQQLKEFVQDLKRSPCKDCGGSFNPWVMDFDHVDGEKIANVAFLVTHGSKSKILEEVSKCDLVCANCHRERTYQRQLAGESGSWS